MNVKVLNLMSRINETRNIKSHEIFKWKCSIDARCNNKQHWDNDKCRCECKELIDKGICGKGFIWNISNCESECDKSCDIVEYLDYENCKCRKRLTDKSVKECVENIDGNGMTNVTLKEYKNVYGSRTVYIVLLVIFFILIISIGSILIYFHLYSKKKGKSKC